MTETQNRPWVVVLLSRDGNTVRYIGERGSTTAYRILARTFPSAHEARVVAQIWSRFPLFEMGGVGEYAVEQK